MSDPRLPRLVYFVLLLLGLLSWARVYSDLPALMASHFDFSGAPNGWMSKQAFLALMFVVSASSAVVAFFAPRQIAAKSPDRLNLPNKSYWLAPERSADTFRYITTQFAWFGCGILFVLLYGANQALNANLPGGHFDSTSMLNVIIAFVLLTVLWTFLLIRHFSRLPHSSA